MCISTNGSVLSLGWRYVPSLLLFLFTQPPFHHWATQFFPLVGPEDDRLLRTLQGASWVLEAERGEVRSEGIFSCSPFHGTLPQTESFHWLSGREVEPGFRRTGERRSLCHSPTSTSRSLKWIVDCKPLKGGTNKTKKKLERKVFVEFSSSPWDSLH